MGICHFWEWVSLTHLIDQTTVLNGKLSRSSLKFVLLVRWDRTSISVSDWVSTYVHWILVWTLFDQSIGGTHPRTETKKILVRRLILEPQAVSLLLSWCSTSTPTCLSRTCAQTLEESVRVKLDYGGTAMPWQRSALSECCEFVIKHRRLVWNMVFVSQNNSNMTGIIQTTPNVSRKDTGFQINYLGVLHLGWND